jgi:hypothetical protein
VREERRIGRPNWTKNYREAYGKYVPIATPMKNIATNRSIMQLVPEGADRANEIVCSKAVFRGDSSKRSLCRQFTSHFVVKPIRQLNKPLLPGIAFI